MNWFSRTVILELIANLEVRVGWAAQLGSIQSHHFYTIKSHHFHTGLPRTISMPNFCTGRGVLLVALATLSCVTAEMGIDCEVPAALVLSSRHHFKTMRHHSIIMTTNSSCWQGSACTFCLLSMRLQPLCCPDWQGCPVDLCHADRCLLMAGTAQDPGRHPARRDVCRWQVRLRQPVRVPSL